MGSYREIPILRQVILIVFVWMMSLHNEEATEEKPTEEAPTEIESMLETAPILEVDKLNQTIAEFDDDM